MWAPWLAVLCLIQSRFSFTEKPPGLGMEQLSVGPCAWSHSGVYSVALGAASVQVWVGQVWKYCGNHVLFWWGAGLGLWHVHGFCTPLLGGGIHL